MNYIGSKLSLMDFLEDTIYDITGYTKGKYFVFADLFAGTGIVGVNFKKNGCKVISNDIQWYSYILSKHYIENNSEMDVSLLKYLNNLEGVDGFIFNNYCAGSGSNRNYFSDYNGRKCDAIRQELEKLYVNRQINDNQYYYFLASLINSIDKYANTTSVYGAFLKHIKKSAQKNFELELLPIIKGSNDGVVYNINSNDLIKNIKGDVLYLDPPYNARQYGANYHILETISKYDNPQIRGKTGLRDYKNQKSDFCSRRTVEVAFENLIADADFKFIFLSYNNEGLMNFDAIKFIMGKYGKYKAVTTEYRRFKADKLENRKYKVDAITEYLHCLIKNQE